MRPTLKLLDRETIERVHNAALQILERVGVRYSAPAAEDLLRAAGQKLDEKTRVVRLAPELVERCLRLSPPEVRLAARDPGRDVVLGQGRVHVCLDGQGTFTLDRVSGVRRPATLDDLVEATRLSDALESVDVYWAPVVAGDVPDAVRGLTEWATGFRHCSRHVQHELKTPGEVPYLLEMLDVLVGDRARLRARPIFSLTVCPVSPLQHEAEMTAACLQMARHFTPMCVLPMPLAGATAPVTLLGTAAQCVAEFLSGLVLFQLAQPGCPVLFGVGATILDMRTGLYSAGAPELPLLNLALTELGHHYGVPVMTQGMVTDAKQPGPQASAEKTMNGLVVALAGADLVNGLGLLDSSQLLSLPQMVLDDEAFRAIRRVASGFETDAARLMADLVEEVGVGGNFLGKRATLAYLKAGEHFEPRLGQRGSSEAWARRGKSELALADERVERLLKEHAVLPLPRESERALDEILARAGRVPSLR
jgi:trimethylamine--corrinoid protein Co-methyltransferase